MLTSKFSNLVYLTFVCLVNALLSFRLAHSIGILQSATLGQLICLPIAFLFWLLFVPFCLLKTYNFSTDGQTVTYGMLQTLAIETPVVKAIYHLLPPLHVFCHLLSALAFLTATIVGQNLDTEPTSSSFGLLFDVTPQAGSVKANNLAELANFFIAGTVAMTFTYPAVIWRLHKGFSVMIALHCFLAGLCQTFSFAAASQVISYGPRVEPNAGRMFLGIPVFLGLYTLSAILLHFSAVPLVTFVCLPGFDRSRPDKPALLTNGQKVSSNLAAVLLLVILTGITVPRIYDQVWLWRLNDSSLILACLVSNAAFFVFWITTWFILTIRPGLVLSGISADFTTPCETCGSSQTHHNSGDKCRIGVEHGNGDSSSGPSSGNTGTSSLSKSKPSRRSSHHSRASHQLLLSKEAEALLLQPVHSTPGKWTANNLTLESGSYDLNRSAALFPAAAGSRSGERVRSASAMAGLIYPPSSHSESQRLLPMSTPSGTQPPLMLPFVRHDARRMSLPMVYKNPATSSSSHAPIVGSWLDSIPENHMSSSSTGRIGRFNRSSDGCNLLGVGGNPLPVHNPYQTALSAMGRSSSCVSSSTEKYVQLLRDDLAKKKLLAPFPSGKGHATATSTTTTRSAFSPLLTIQPSPPTAATARTFKLEPFAEVTSTLNNLPDSDEKKQT